MPGESEEARDVGVAVTAIKGSNSLAASMDAFPGVALSVGPMIVT